MFLAIAAPTVTVAAVNLALAVSFGGAGPLLLGVGNAVVLTGAGVAGVRRANRLESEHERAVGAARESGAEAERLLQVIDNTSAVICIRDRDGRYLLVNREYENLFGVRRQDVVGLTDHDVFPASIADEYRANDLRTLRQAEALQFQEIAPHPDGGTHTYVTVKYPIPGPDGEPVAVCGISTDITDVKRAEDRIRTLNTDLEMRVKERTADLEETTRELDAFAYSVSHDLRAPLRSLDGFSELLLADYEKELDGPGRDYLHRIQAATRRMGELIDDLLDLSRATRVELVREPVDVSLLARDTVAELRSEEPAREIRVSIADGMACSGDPRLVRLVLRNLFANAWKFTAKRLVGYVEMGMTDGDGVPVFFVRDNGAGFDMHYAHKLFTPFQRLHTVTDFPGNGIGLAIVARIVRRHGGRVWAWGEPGHGATFYFTLLPDEGGTP